MGISRLRFAGAVAVLASGVAHGHHSFGTFDMNQNVEIVGTIAGIDFVNPHAWLRIDARAADGAATQYRCEMRGATVLRRSGWTPEMFVTGAPITVQGAPDRLDPTACYVNTLVLADGRALDRYSQREAGEPAAPSSPNQSEAVLPRTPNGMPNLAGDWAVEQRLMTDPRGRFGSLVPASTVAEFEPGAVPSNNIAIPGSEGFTAFSLAAIMYRITVGAVPTEGLPWIDQPVRRTERGLAAIPPPEQHPQFQCLPTSIIFNWYIETLVNRIRQDEQSVSIEYGHGGFVRTVHLNDDHPTTIEPSRTGHSIGRWDGDVLVVDTIGFLPGMLANEVAHGDQLHVVERFSLNADGSVLTREYVATDPDYFVGEYRGFDVTPRSRLPFVEDECDAALNPFVQ